MVDAAIHAIQEIMWKHPEALLYGQDVGERIGGVFREFLFGSTGPRGGKRDGIVQQVARNEARRMGTKVLRGVLGGIFGGRR